MSREAPAGAYGGPYGGLHFDMVEAQTGPMSPLLLLAVPEVENVSDGSTLARVQAIADELEKWQAVDWDEDLARGGGPALALGAERRSAPR